MLSELPLARRLVPIAGALAIVLVLLSSGLLPGGLPGTSRGPVASSPVAPASLGAPTPGIGDSLSESTPAWTLVPRGLPSGTPWQVDVGGVLHRAVAPDAIAIDAVGGTEPIHYAPSAQSQTYGTRFNAPAGVLPMPGALGGATVPVPFSSKYLVQIASVPNIPAYSAATSYGGCYGTTVWDSPYCNYVNYNLTPMPGAQWVAAGTSIALSATPVGATCSTYCDYVQVNLTFLSFNGQGKGSSNTTAGATTLVANGPINETASFLYDGYCYYAGTSAPSCVNSNASVTFLEHGLPAGTRWSVATWGPEANASNPQVNASVSTSQAICSPATIGVTDFDAYAIPGRTSGTYWVPSVSPAGPVELPANPIVHVNYTLQASAPASSVLLAEAVGLPTTSTAWSISLGGSLYGLSGSEGTFALPPGTLGVNATPVYLPNGTGFYPDAVDFEPFAENSSWSNSSTVPATLHPVAGGFLEVRFAPMFLVRASASEGGSVSTSYLWDPAGRAQPLSASPSAGYEFVGWTGSGTGAVSSPQANITVHPGSPVEELATFRPIPALTYNLTIRAVGVPGTTNVTVQIGSRSYSGNGSFVVTGLLAGNYSVRPLAVNANASLYSRFLPTGWNSSLPSAPGGAVAVDAPGSVTVAYVSQFLLTVQATGPGSVSPSGSLWSSLGNRTALSATPMAGARLLGWSGSGPGSAGGANGSITVSSEGPIVEIAEFVAAIAPVPVTYSTTFVATGLPEGAVWSLSIGPYSAAGSSRTITFTGLNGTYPLQIGDVAGANGSRYAPSGPARTLQIRANQTLEVAFHPQFLVTVIVGAGGAVNGSTGWFDANSTVTLAETPAPDYRFVNWTLSPGRSGTGATIQLEVEGPVVVTAGFAALTPAAAHAGVSPAAALPTLEVLGGMALLGLLAGALLGWLPRGVGEGETGASEAPADEDPFPTGPTDPAAFLPSGPETEAASEPPDVEEPAADFQ